MKRFPLTSVLLGLTFLLPSSLVADLLFYEGFESFTEWSGAAPITGGANLAYADLPDSAGAGASTTWSDSVRTVDHDLANGTLYISFLMQVSAFDDAGWTESRLFINRSESSSPTAIFTASGMDTLYFNYVEFDESGQSYVDGIWSQGSLDTAKVYLHVIELSQAGSLMQARVWRYDDGTVPTAVPMSGDSFTMPIGDGVIRNIGLYNFGVTSGSIDEIRVATSWDDVINGGPPPPPPPPPMPPPPAPVPPEGIRKGGSGDPLRIMCVGDSITLGYSPENLGGGYRGVLYNIMTDASNGYTVDYVGTHAANPGGAADVHNGYSCNTIQQVRDLLYGPPQNQYWCNNRWNSILGADWQPAYPQGDILDKMPEVVLLMLGTNNCSPGVLTSQLDTDLDDLEGFLRMIITDIPDVYLLVSTLPPRPNVAPQESSQPLVDYFNFQAPNNVGVIVNRLAGEGYRVWQVDNSQIGMAAADGLHPSRSGWDELAANWFAVLDDLPPLPSPPAAGYGDWANTHGITGSETDDEDADGVPNLLEYALGMDATSGADHGTRLPQLDRNGQRLMLTFSRSADATDLHYIVEACDDLAATPLVWEELARSSGGVQATETAGGVVVSDPGGSGEISVVVTDYRDLTSPRFIRLRVEIP